MATKAKTGAFDRCVKAVKKSGSAKSPRGVCATQERRRGLNRGKKVRRNPEEAAAERYEYFHGRAPEQVTTIETPVRTHSVLSGVGKLIKLVIQATDGKTEVSIANFRGSLLAQNETGTQLFIEGGHQGVNLADFGISKSKHHENEVLGALVEVWYDTRKDHLVDGGDAIYHHRFGGRGKRLPIVLYDVRNRLLSIAGGEYDMPEVGIRG